MSQIEILNNIRDAVLEGDDDLALELVQKALKEGKDPLDIINEGIVPGIQEAGELWKKNEYFQPDVVMSAEAFRVSMEIIEPLLSSDEIGAAGKVVIGTVEGDMHTLGKLMVVAMMRSAGFQVIDIGEDIAVTTFIEKVRDLNPDILGLGCYMTTTMLEMKKIIQRLKNDGIRNNIKVMIGGVPTTQEYADEIGADSWGRDAFDAAEKAKQLMGVS